MDWHNPILHPILFVPHMMFEHYHLRPPTLPNEDIKRDFTPMTTSPGQLAKTSLDISSSTSDTYELLHSVRDVLSTLQLDSEGNVIGDEDMVVDSEVEKREIEDDLQ